MRLYETTIVIDPQLKSTEIEDVIKKATTFITDHGGEIVEQNEWGKKRLAYEINRKQYGYYVLIRFKAPGQVIKLLEREYRLSEPIMRYLTIVVDKKMLKFEALKKRQAEAKAEEAEAAAEAAEARRAAAAAEEAKEAVTEEESQAEEVVVEESAADDQPAKADEAPAAEQDTEKSPEA